jgi:hypothetical protein
MLSIGWVNAHPFKPGIRLVKHLEMGYGYRFTIYRRNKQDPLCIV